MRINFINVAVDEIVIQCIVKTRIGVSKRLSGFFDGILKIYRGKIFFR